MCRPSRRRCGSTWSPQRPVPSHRISKWTEMIQGYRKVFSVSADDTPQCKTRTRRWFWTHWQMSWFLWKNQQPGCWDVLSRTRKFFYLLVGSLRISSLLAAEGLWTHHETKKRFSPDRPVPIRAAASPEPEQKRAAFFLRPKPNGLQGKRTWILETQFGLFHHSLTLKRFLLPEIRNG